MTRDAIRQRQSPGRQFYKTQRWKNLRRAFLRTHPACAVCGRKSGHVDHMQAHCGSLRMFFAPENLQALCHGCHSAKTSRQDTGFGNPRRGPGSPSGACGSDGLPLDPQHPWNN